MEVTPVVQPFRLVIVGAGEITRQAHLPAAMACRGVQVTALVDPSTERARSLVERNGLEATATADLAQALQQADGALIASPNHTHRDIALRCIQAGVHVLIEKPMTTTTEDAEAIASAAAEAGVTVGVGYCTRFMDSVRLMKELLDQSYFGAIKRFAYQFGTRGGWAPASGYTLSRDSAGGGVLVVSGTHFLDRMLYWFGYPDEIQYWDDSLGGPEATARAQVTYKQGRRKVVGDILLSKTVAMPAGFAMETSKGTVTFHEGGGGHIRFIPKDRPDLEHAVTRREVGDQRNMYQVQIEDFVAACGDPEREPAISARQGVDNVRLTDAMYACRQPLSESWYPQT